MGQAYELTLNKWLRAGMVFGLENRNEEIFTFDDQERKFPYMDTTCGYLRNE